MVRNWKNGDIASSGRQFVDGREETRLNVLYRLRLFLGEYFLNIAEGTPWFQSILGKTPQDIAEINIKQRILTTPRVAGLEEFRFRSDRAQRRLTVDARIVDDTGDTAELALDEEIV